MSAPRPTLGGRALGIAAAIASLLTCLACIVVVLWVPPNVDEALPFHPIACSAYPVAKLHTLSEPCDGTYDLHTLGLTFPRAYHYLGGTSSLFYLPFFTIYRHYLSARLLGVLAFGACLLGIKQLTRARAWIVLAVAGSSFPLVYQVIADTGPVGYPCALMVLVPALAQRILAQRRPSMRVLSAMLLGIAVALGIEQKPFFLLLLPIVIGVSFGLGRVGFVRSLWPALAVVAIFALVLFTARDSGENTYWSAMEKHRMPPGPLLGYLADFTQFAHRVYGPFTRAAPRPNVAYWSTVLGHREGVASAAVFWLCGCAAIAMAALKCAAGRGRIILFGAAAALVWLLLLLQRHRGVWAGHHVVFVFPYLLCAIVTSIEELLPRRQIVIALALVASQIVPFWTVIHRAPRVESSWGRLDVQAFIAHERLARTSIVAAVDWGVYHLYALYGERDQLVTYLNPPNADAVRQLKKLADETGREVLIVKRTRREIAPALLETFPVVTRLYTSPDDTWELLRARVGSPIGAAP